jgi:transposase
MIQLLPHLKILLAIHPVDFRRGIESLVAMCRDYLSSDPFSGTLFVFRNKGSTSIKLLVYDGQGFWLCQKRLSSGRFLFWPSSDEHLHPLAAHQLSVLLYNGNPLDSNFPPFWRPISPDYAASAATPAL